MTDIRETDAADMRAAIEALPDPADFTPEQVALIEFLYRHALGWLKSNPRFKGYEQDAYEVNALVLVSWWIRDHGLTWPHQVAE